MAVGDGAFRRDDALSTERKRVLLLGASGNVGYAATERFLRERDFDVVAVSRRQPDFGERQRYVHLQVDLSSPDAVARLGGDVSSVTHIVYAALFEEPSLIAGWTDEEQIASNRQMLANVIDAAAATHAPIEHFSILQGTKAYGYHIGKMRIPGKERYSRVAHPNFYWEQEDRLRAAAREMGFSYTIFRPQFVFGGVIGVAMNLIPVIGAYAAICKELGRPFSYPGGASYVAEAVDSRLLADALCWAARSPAARNETFNITNGDVFEWRDLWASLGQMLGVEAGPDHALSLAAWLPRQAEVWERIVERHNLRPVALDKLLGLSHQYADDAFAYTADGTPLRSRATPVFLSTIKLRRAGFGACIDTEEMFAYWFGRLREDRILP